MLIRSIMEHQMRGVLRNFFDSIIDLRTLPGDIWLV
jgi:hypothetical protein